MKRIPVKIVKPKTLKVAVKFNPGKIHLGDMTPDQVELGQAAWFQYHDKRNCKYPFKVQKTEDGKFIGCSTEPGSYFLAKYGGRYIDVSKGYLFAFKWSM